MFKNSYLKISSDRFSTTVPMVLIKDIKFLFSDWEFYDTDIIMSNCNTSLLLLNINLCAKNSNSTNVTPTVNISNCTIGCVKFSCIKDIQIKDCSITRNPFSHNKIIADFTYSTAVLDTIFIQNLNFDCSDVEFCGLVISHFSQVIIKNSFYERNINASISVVNDSSLVMKNCTILHNDVFKGVIVGRMGVIHITNSVFENNIRSE